MVFLPKMKQEHLQHILLTPICKQALRYPFITVLCFKQAINMYVFSVQIYKHMCLIMNV